MQDIQLFWQLEGGSLDDPTLPARLERAAELSLERRLALFAVIERALAHADPALRAAAVALLAGADGRIALGAELRALDDPSGAVQRAGVEALRVSAAKCSARWAHALFHPAPSVRQAAVSGAAPPGAAELEAYLLVDPECRARIRDRLVIDHHALPLVSALTDRGELTHAEAARLLVGLDPRDLLATTEAGRALPDTDAFDDLFAIVLGGEPEIVETLAHALGGALSAARPELRMRAAASLRRFGPRLSAPLLGLLAQTHPPALGWPELSREARRRAALALYDAPRAARVERELARELLLELVPDGETIDLAVAGALLRLVQDKPYALLFDAFGRERVVDAFVADALHAAPLLGVADDSKRGRKHLMDLVATRGVLPSGMLEALLAWVLPTDALDFIDGIPHSSALTLCGSLLQLERDPRVLLKPRKVDRLATALSHRLTHDRKEHLVRRAVTRVWGQLLAHPDPMRSAFGMALLGELSRRTSTEVFVDAMLALGTTRLFAVIRILPAAARVAYGKELALASALADHEDPELRSWAAEKLGTRSAPALAPTPPGTVIDVPPALARASSSDLEAACAALCGTAQRGLATVLARRGAPAPSIAVCVALLGSWDDPHEVARQFERFREDHPRFLRELDARAVGAWSTHPELPLLGAAWLWRWERQAERLATLLRQAPGGSVGALEAALSLPSALLRAELWRGVAAAWAVWAARKRDWLIAMDEAEGDALVALCVRELASDCGAGAAEILNALHRVGSPAVQRAVSAIAQRLPDATDDVRQRLSRIVSARGLPPRSAAERRKRALSGEERAQIRALTDLEALARLCADPDPALAEEACLRLVELGPDGALWIAELVLRDAPVPSFRVLVESVPLWPDCPALERLRARLDGGPAELRFRLALALVERGETAAIELALGAAVEPGKADWLASADVDRLARQLPGPELWRRLATSPHPHAYRRALDTLIAASDGEPEDRAAVRAFLSMGTERQHDLRRLAATWLANRDDAFGFPLLLEHTVTTGTMRLYPKLDPRHVHWAVSAVLFAGPGESREDHLLQALSASSVPAAALDLAWERLLSDAASLRTLRIVAQRASRRPARSGKLRTIAEVFAWGARVAPMLTGKRLRAHLTEGHDLGHTRLDQARIHVSALPVLRADRHGREIVEGLVLHELGHHRHHAGAGAERVWQDAEKIGVFQLLNLVADEHLERNLRALDPGFGDRLKRLAAWAFQHADRDLPVSFVVRALGVRTFEVLTRVRLGLAQRSDSVRVESGALLREMERAGMSFARFVRALRMGLGDRHGDALVERALTLFDKAFRKSDMARLLEIARELQALFGWEAVLAGQYGGHESGPGGERDHIVHGDAIGDDEVQQEVERISDPKRRPRGGGGGRGDRLWINVSDTPVFDRIHQVVPLVRDGAQHQQLARDVRRHSQRLRRVLEELGLSRQPSRGRLQGVRVDAGRLRALVVRGEPRVLVRRELAVRNDLFLGVAVDCSGSMQSGANIDKARRFAVLLAEAARGLRGVDLRVFGFTDSVLYDAGDAERSAAASLSAGGGNNDAAALLHVAEIAKKSRRSARLLVMVSDGLPTECSTEALRSLVERLERRERMCVAQVAVRPLEEICFRHHVLLEEDDLDGSVRRFGQTVGRLVRRAVRP